MSRAGIEEKTLSGKFKILLQEKPEKDLEPSPTDDEEQFTQLVIDCTHYMDGSRQRRQELVDWYLQCTDGEDGQRLHL